jgi:hypothetical protein
VDMMIISLKWMIAGGVTIHAPAAGDDFGGF